LEFLDEGVHEMKTNRQYTLFVLLAVLLLAGCKDLFHPEGPGQPKSNDNSNGKDPGDSNTIGAPSIPQGVYAYAVSSDTISVTWNPVSGASGYRIYRSGSPSGIYSLRGDNGSEAYYDTGLSPNTTYYYTVSAYNSYGESTQSNYVSATTLSGGLSNSLVGTIWYAYDGYDSYMLQFISPTELYYSSSVFTHQLIYSYDGGSNLIVVFEDGYTATCIVSTNSIDFFGYLTFYKQQ
jgi:hypothetical protein